MGYVDRYVDHGLRACIVKPGELLRIQCSPFSCVVLHRTSPWMRAEAASSSYCYVVTELHEGDVCLVVSHDADAPSPYLFVVCRNTYGWVRRDWLVAT
jgi:hypothetical protein